MPYRDLTTDDLDAARRAHTEAARAALDSVRTRRAELAEREADLTSELASLEAEARRRLPMLPRIEIASPCSAKWEEMRGDGNTRHCAQCEKDVHDLSAMTHDEASAFLSRTMATGPCVRLFLRDDGRFLTADCPVGLERRRRRRALPAVALAAMMCSLHFMGATLSLQMLVDAARDATREAPTPCALPPTPVPMPVEIGAPPPVAPVAPVFTEGFLHVRAPADVEVEVSGVGRVTGFAAVSPGVHILRMTRRDAGGKLHVGVRTVSVAAGEHRYVDVFAGPGGVPEERRPMLTGVTPPKPYRR